LLKHIYGLSDEGACERWVYDPYFQHFTGEEFFQHEFPHERSDLSHWRKRLGNKLELLLAESLRVAHESGALRTKDLAPTGTLSPQDGHLMSQGNKLKFQRSAAANTEFEDRNNGAENRHHDHDSMAGPRKSPVFLSLV
jgi:IS5 family transposase